MNKQEAIEILKTWRHNMADNGVPDFMDKYRALNMAIEALSADAVHKPDYSYEADMVRRLRNIGRVMEVRINLNEIVKFKLSERGKEIYRHRYDGLEPELDDDGYMSMQLRTFMRAFGEHMIPGVPEVVQPFEIICGESEDE